MNIDQARNELSRRLIDLKYAQLSGESERIRSAQ